MRLAGSGGVSGIFIYGGVVMAKNGQLTAAWEMLSTVVMLRAKAKEQQLGKLLSSLHGVEVELARIIAAGDDTGASGAEMKTSASVEMAEGAGGVKSRQRALVPSRQAQLAGSSSASTATRRRQDAQLDTYCRKYLAIAEQLKDVMVRGEVAACGPDAPFEEGAYDTHADALMSEQHDLSLSIARLRASTPGGLAQKAAVLDDLVEENSDDPVQALARSLARDVMDLHRERRLAS
jgi:hypothetical protein